MGVGNEPIDVSCSLVRNFDVVVLGLQSFCFRILLESVKVSPLLFCHWLRSLKRCIPKLRLQQANVVSKDSYVWILERETMQKMAV